MEDHAIELTDLDRSYGAVRALDGVSLQVQRGQVFGYVGPNGAGKTTTIKILVGLLRPSGGSARVCGLDVLEQGLEVKARIGFLPETGAVFERLSAREYLDLVGTLYGLSDGQIRERSEHWLRSFGLLDQAGVPMTTFSRGTRQKVCWMAALLHDPEVLVLDEPLTGLDVETVSRIKELLSRLAAEGKTVFYSSHMIDVVEKICSRIGVLYQGRLLACGSPDEVRALTGEATLEQSLVKLWQSRKGP